MIQMRRIVAFLSVSVLFQTALLWSAPHWGEHMDVPQPDGTRVPVVVWGDDYYVRAETPDGYTLIRDPQTGWICYAELNADSSELQSTGIVYHGETLDNNQKSASGTVSTQALAQLQAKKARLSQVGKRVRLNRATRLKKVEENRKKLLGDQYNSNTGITLAAPGDESGVIVMADSELIEPALTGTITGLTLLIDFPNSRGTISRNTIDNFCNQEGYTGYSNKGSVRDYFYDTSNGKLTYLNIVTEYYTAKNDKSYYTDPSISYGTRARELIREALDDLESKNFDFSKLSLSGGRIRALNAYYAGSRDNAWSEGLWPHKASYNSFTSANYGVKSGSYQITNIGTSLRLGTFCHENGHMILGLPDLYDYGGESRGIGNYGLMAGGGSSTNPVPVNPYFREIKGWETIIDITDSGGGTTYSHRSNSFLTYKYLNKAYSKEYFLIESNIKTGRRSSMPDEGLLIWHIDTAGSNNNEQMTAAEHYKVSVEQADGNFSLEKDSNSGGGGDLFHQGYKDRFDAATTPNSNWWSGEDSGLMVSNVSAVGSPMTFVAMNANLDFWMTPNDTLRFSRLESDPILPSSIDLTLHNDSTTRTISYTISSSASWLTLESSSGTLAPQSSTVIKVTPKSAVNAAVGATLTDTIVVTDTTTTAQYVRPVSLVVRNRRAVAYWPLDETTGTQAADMTRNGYDAMLSGNLSFDNNRVDGVYGGALNLDGLDDYVDVPDGFDDWTTGYTVSLWAYPTGVKTWARFFDFGNGAGVDNLLMARRGLSNDCEIDAYNGKTKVGRLLVPNAIALNQWQHFLVSIDASGHCVFYKNGQPMANGDVGIPSSVKRVSNYIGRSNWPADEYYQGYLDDFRVYNYALTAEQAASIYRNGGGSFNFTPVPEGANIYCDSRVSWLPGPQVHDYHVYWGLNQAAVSEADRFSDAFLLNSRTPQIDTPVLWPDTDIYWRVDDVMTDGSIVKGQVMHFKTTGSISREVWLNISGTAITDLTDSSAYPDRADSRDYMTSFEAPTNWADDYGTRMHGYLVPQTSGVYTFWIAGDDNCELWLSGDTDPAKAVKIAYVPGWSSSRDWAKYSQQKSSAVTLQAGKRYYIMALQKEDGGGDNLAVAWQGPDSPSRSVIPGRFLQPFQGNKPPRFNHAYEEKAGAVEGQLFADKLVATAKDPDGQTIVYRKAGGPEWLTILSDGTLSGVPTWQDSGDNYFTVIADDGHSGQAELLLNVIVADKHSGQRGTPDLVDFVTNWLKDNVIEGQPEAVSDLIHDQNVDLLDWAYLASDWKAGLVPGLMSYYSFDGWWSATIADNYGSRPATMVNGSEYNRANGILGDALRFDGIDDRAECGVFDPMAETGSFSVSLWFNPDDISQIHTETLIGRRNESQHLWGLLLWGSNSRHLTALVNGAEAYALTETSVTPSVGQWMHVVMTYDDQGDRKVHLYVNGVEAAVIQQTATVGEMVSSDAVPVTLGDRVGGGRSFVGKLDEVYIYNRVLTLPEIQRLSQADQLEANWAFDVNANDSQGGHDGALKNGAKLVENALSLDGADDYVEVPAVGDWNDSEQFTVSAWIKPNQMALVNTALVIGQRDTANHLWSLSLWGSNGGHVTGYVNGTTGDALTEAAVTPQAGSWHHIAMTYDNSADRRVWIYVDGVAVDNVQQRALQGNRELSEAVPVTMGDRIGGGKAYSGSIDAVKYYRRILSAEEIADLARVHN